MTARFDDLIQVATGEQLTAAGSDVSSFEDVGLLDGLAGVGLALTAIRGATDVVESGWDACLLIA